MKLWSDSLGSVVKAREKEILDLERKIKDLGDSLEDTKMVKNLCQEVSKLRNVVAERQVALLKLHMVEAENLEAKCEGYAKERLENELITKGLREKVDSLMSEISAAQSNRAAIIARVIPYVVDQLLKSDEFGVAAAKFIEAAYAWGRCIALEETATLGRPLNLADVEDCHPDAVTAYEVASKDFNKTVYPFIQHVATQTSCTISELLSLVPQKIAPEVPPV